MKRDARYRLLYVEDEAYIREMAVEFLRDRFIEIYQASNGDEAFKIYRDKKPDIIITDIKMPRMDGLTLAQKIREQESITPIIILTAYTDTNYLLKATELNLVKYLIKPIQEEQLNEALKLCFKKIESRDESVILLTKGYRYDLFNHTLSLNAQIIRLTSSQTKLLEMLIKQRGNVVSYAQLENGVWYDEGMSKDALRCLIRDIRKATDKELIENISKVGYRVNLDG